MMYDTRNLVKAPTILLNSIAEKNRIIIFATQRSGSTYLCERLHAHDFGHGNEHILDYVRPSELDSLQSGSYANEIASRFNLDEFIAKGINLNYYCTKIMANYVHSFCGLLQNTAAIFDVDLQSSLLKATFGKAEYVFLYRPNRVAQAVSRVIAAQTGVWHRVGAAGAYSDSAVIADSAYNRSVIFRPCDILDQVNAIADEERALSRLQHALRTQDLATVTVLYDGYRFLLAPSSNAIPDWLATTLTDIQFNGQALDRLSNIYNQLFERAFYDYLKLRKPGSASWTPMQQRAASLAAVAGCAELDAEWTREQMAIISVENG